MPSSNTSGGPGGPIDVNVTNRAVPVEVIQFLNEGDRRVFEDFTDEIARLRTELTTTRSDMAASLADLADAVVDTGGDFRSQGDLSPNASRQQYEQQERVKTGGPSNAPDAPISMPTGEQEPDAQAINGIIARLAQTRIGGLAHTALKDLIPQYGAALQGDKSKGLDPQSPGFGTFAGSLAQYAGQVAIPAWMISQGHQVQQTISNYIPTPGAMSALGQQLGTPPSQGGQEISIGGYGFRVPLGAIGAGISDYASSLWTGVTTPGLSVPEVMASKNAIADLGWTPDDAAYGDMADSLNELTQFGGERLGQNPQVAAMLDQSTRLGQSSIEQFTDTMKRVPEAAHNAHVSWEQLISDMEAMGEANQAQGGTFAGGMQLATDWNSITGLPAAPLSQALQNPYVTSYATRETGLMPDMQGLMSPGSRISSVYGAVNQMGDMLDFNAYKEDLGHGFSQRYSSKDQEIAYLHTQFPEFSTGMLKNMTDPQKRRGVEAGANISNLMGSLSDKVRRHEVGTGSGLMSLDPDAAKGNFGDFMKQARMARDERGRRMFSNDEIDDIKYAGMDPAESDGMLGGVGGLGTHPTQISEDVRDRVLEKMGYDKGGGILSGVDLSKQQEMLQSDRGRRLTAQALQNEREKALREAMDKTRNTDKNQPDVTIELGPAAKQMFHLQGNRGSAKANANAGAGTTLEGFEGASQIMPFGQ